VEVLSSRILLRPGDLGRSRRFYRDVLGLAVYREFGPPEDPGMVFFLGQGFLEVSGPWGLTEMCVHRRGDVIDWATDRAYVARHVGKRRRHCCPAGRNRISLMARRRGRLRMKAMISATSSAVTSALS
jgi:catechol 2,3-dioxygenase-like lactoylglutathione lyase family enzyme